MWNLCLSHPTGNPNVRNAALALAEAGMLRSLITTLAYNPQSQWAQWIRKLPAPMALSLEAQLRRRSWDLPESIPIHTYGLPEVGRLLLTRLYQRWGGSTAALTNWIYAYLDRQVAHHHLNGLDGIYAYEDGAATTFRAAKERGIKCFYDLPIIFYPLSQRLHQEEAERFPELAPYLQAIHEPPWKLARKDEEVALADHIFVASSFTRQSLLEAGVRGDRISVIPYGAPTAYFQPGPKPDAQFRALFVGLLTPRKGLQYLLPAWQTLGLPDAELLLVGTWQLPNRWGSRYDECIRHVDSVPHHQLERYYQSANVLVFPSLVEGFGLVLLEAMACGIPIITTPHTAGPDLITDGVEGFIVPIRDTAALQEKLEWAYHHPQELAAMGQAARRRAESLSWAAYREQLRSQITTLCEVLPRLP